MACGPRFVAIGARSLRALLFVFVALSVASARVSAQEEIWYFALVDHDSVYGGVNPALALDASGNPHAAYVEATDNTLSDWRIRYASNDGAGWVAETVETIPATVSRSFLDIGVDTCGIAHLVYRTDTTIKHAFKGEGASWTIQPVPDTLSTFVYSEVALALDGCNPRIAYRSDVALMYAQKDGEAWAVESTCLVSGTGSTFDLALDSMGRPHVFYPNHYWYYAVDTGGTCWSNEIVDDWSATTQTTLAIDANDRPHALYRSPSGVRPRYAQKVMGTWEHCDCHRTHKSGHGGTFQKRPLRVAV